MIVLFGVPISPYVRKVKIALREKGIPFDMQVADPLLRILPDRFVAASPRLEVPALVDGDLAVFDSRIILEYLEDAFPDPPLRPADPAGRARARMLEEIADTQFEAANWALGEIRFFGRAEGDQARRLTEAAAGAIARHLDRLEAELAERSHLSGRSFGLADVALVPHVTAADFFGFGPGPERPRLDAWLERMRSRDSVRRDLEEVLAAVGSFGERRGARQYRDHRLEWMMKHGGDSIVREGLERGTIELARDV